MTNIWRCSIPKGWAAVAICAALAFTGCGPAMHQHGQNPVDALFGPIPDHVPDSGLHNAPVPVDDGYYQEAGYQQDAYYDEGYADDGYMGNGYAEGGFVEDGYYDSGNYGPGYADAHGYDCFECGPGRPGPIRGLIHDMFHHRGPIAKTVQFLLCDHCGGNANICGCGGGQHGHASYGLFEKPPIAVENSVGPCWGYYKTAWRRFPPHCPNEPVPMPVGGPLPADMPEAIGPGVSNGQDNGSQPQPGPSILPAPTDGNGGGFQAANPNRKPQWQTARSNNPMRGDESAERRTAWKPAARMSWMPLRTADERHWRKPNDEGTVVR